MDLTNYIQIILCSFLFTSVFCQYFEFPDYQIEVYEPKGFKISIPDADGITLFAIHININQDMETLEAGHISRDIVKKRGDRWVYEDKNLRLKIGDKLYFWLYVIVDGLGYRKDNQEYTVRDYISRGESPAPVPTPGIDRPRPSPGVVPPRPSPDIEKCQTSSTLVSGNQVCRDQVIYLEQFNDRVIPGGTIKNWISEIHIPRTADSFFTILDNKNVKVENGQLIIKPTLTEDTYGKDILTSAQVTLQGCTSEIKDNCETTGFAWNIIPPILSSRVNTKENFSFKYGIVEVRAKLPQGDWIVPEIWLISKNQGPTPSKIILARSFGNADLTLNGIRIGGQRLSQGISRSSNQTMLFSKDNNNLWSNDFHIYKIHWAPDSVRFLVDDSEVGRLDRLPINNECYISIGVHVGGIEDFPDDSINRGNAKPWINREIRNSVNFWEAKNSWYSSWNGHSSLRVDYIKVIAL